ncbi:MAG: conjugal transfer protein TraX [Parasporobacterium sp.]|nr:conjugal transfer protein TraX [Parasporobacterium sp.]
MDVKKGLNSNQIKLIAIIAMTIDHVTWILWPGYDTHWWVIVLHIIGRITAPIMWFFVAEGYYYTRDLRKYILRLFLFAVISHFAYDFALNIPFVPFTTGFFNQTGVIWALFCGLLILTVIDSNTLPGWGKVLLVISLCLISFPADWSCIAALAIMGIGTNRGNFRKQMTWMMLFVFMYSIVYFIFIDKIYAVVQLFTALSIPILKCYNGERGKWKGMKWFFYIYYPVHLVLIGLLRIAL